jgi:hypothetical protein
MPRGPLSEAAAILRCPQVAEALACRACDRAGKSMTEARQLYLADVEDLARDLDALAEGWTPTPGDPDC